MGTPPGSNTHMVPALRSWWCVPFAALIYALTLTAGFAVKAGGTLASEVGGEVTLSQGRTPALVGLSMFIHYAIGPVGAVLILLASFLILFLVRHDPLKALAFVSVAGIGWAGSEAAKFLVGRPRPPADAVHALVSESGATSFPSGHTAFAVALVWAVVLVIGRGSGQKAALMVAGAAFVTLVAFSRLYLGVHYPSDVIGSVLISSATIIAWLPLWMNVLAPRLAGAAILQRFAREISFSR
ncbi:phosphatase PAP2 family protein [Pseudarthrobacter sp. P1]|uniref:phosphatase PAP2 family protein n=1 Tax=Pseudarthrobacter sp. P1 TaxID=3418418 RepID=UPI003CFB10DC